MRGLGDGRRVIVKLGVYRMRSLWLSVVVKGVRDGVGVRLGRIFI